MIRCERMSPATVPHARALLGAFLHEDAHYRASAGAYGDRALALVLARPAIGFVWLAYADENAVGACVVCRAISTSRGTVVAKLDDVTIDPDWQRKGVGGAMLSQLRDHLRVEGMTRIDCGCHRDNEGAWRFYQRLGFVPLNEERLALLIA